VPGSGQVYITGLSDRQEWTFRCLIACCRSVRRLLNGLDYCTRFELPNNFSLLSGAGMTRQERRQTARTTMERHAYINIEPNNGGIVLNVSDGGLCFHSFDPVKPNGTVRFWFSDQNQRIEAAGTVTWTDETQKGGLRFTEMPAEAREKIREWISQPAAALPATPGSAPVSSLRGGPASRDPKDLSNATAPFAPVPSGSIPVQLSGFSRGLATGLVISALVFCVFLFNGYRREFGEWLIKL
jgi:PilZ domain